MTRRGRIGGVDDNLESARRFVGRLSAGAFLAMVEASIVSVVLGLYLSTHPASGRYRMLFLIAALGIAVFCVVLLLLRVRGREQDHPPVDGRLSRRLITLAVILNFWALSIVWLVET